MLICPVRGCGLELMREGRAVRCSRGHSFDVARSGYINLLQPQDRRSKQPGDTPEAVAARRRLHDRGVTAPLLEAVADAVSAGVGEHLLDAGCGEGFYGGGLARWTGCKVHGVDISIPAVDAAARRYPDCEWIVANADRLLPYGEGAFSAVLSITGRMNPAEFRRVLKKDGRLLLAVAAPEDFIELRGRGRERAARTVEMFSSEFALRAERRVTCRAELDPAGLEDVLLSIYRPMSSVPATLASVTFSLDLLLFS